MNDFDSNEFRRVMGAFPTGVVVVTATNETGEALAMTVGSFVSVSLGGFSSLNFLKPDTLYDGYFLARVGLGWEKE